MAWQAVQWPGLEHVIVSSDENAVRANSQLVLASESEGMASISYQLRCDSGWRFTELTITAASADGGRTLTLSADSDGHWLVDGRPQVELDGCADIDISQTPLTNTLPIRRLDWSADTVQELAVVYVSAPELTVHRDRQRYTLLGRDAERSESRYRYESGSFSAELRVDSDGFVLDYPGIWRRVGPGFDTPACRR